MPDSSTSNSVGSPVSIYDSSSFSAPHLRASSHRLSPPIYTSSNMVNFVLITAAELAARTVEPRAPSCPLLPCERDFYGVDLKSLFAADVGTCLKACAVNGACVGASYVTITNTCYLKSTIGRALYNTNVTGTFPFQFCDMEVLTIDRRLPQPVNVAMLVCGRRTAAYWNRRYGSPEACAS